ncbi:hypothetical protein IE81DRAFT_109130 [Ceraceosorus guamensis]|uniref:Vacuole protein n=1 Tax=Ceraceosorus guamensis TaxID=1522189 RepID=A0A316W1Q7_9BASI|nr:hypothetical protein IE81DRAFT_109130 [Ceraceosorus guamensis]PWN43028.1 hypothetical protein IE81DRAFT_109130 [Ceraceosorus guamensis]
MCCGNAEWKREEVPDHKFDFIDVRDYWTNGFLTRLRYGILYLLVAKSIAVYIADIYTAITLLALNHFAGSLYQIAQDGGNDSWSVPLVYGKWVFLGCILFGFLLLAYEAHKARAVIRSRDISYAYTNVMANNYYSLRSYEHFCFFCQINNSKKKKDEFAFFIFFTFKGWKRLLVADGPRQVINALTLVAVGHKVHWSSNVADYYDNNIWTAVLLLTMIFTVLVFAASAIMLIIAAIMYVPLICYIKGNLKEYCCHKIDKRIAELVQKKKKQRLARHAAIARAEAEGDFSHLKNKKGEIIGKAMQQPTLPQVDVDLFGDDTKSPRGMIGNGRPASVASSQIPYGMSEKGFYDQGEVGSNAHLAMNAGAPGYAPGYGSPSLPPSAHTSPDAHPLHFRGRGSDQRPGSPSADVLASMGPIGTSPAFYAQRVTGRGNGGHLAEGGHEDAAYSHAGPHGRSPLSPAYPPPEAYNGQGLGGRPSARQHSNYADYPPDSAGPGPAGNGPADLSAFAPYDDRSARGPSPVPSYGPADVLNMYTHEEQHNGQLNTGIHGNRSQQPSAMGEWDQYHDGLDTPRGDVGASNGGYLHEGSTAVQDAQYAGYDQAQAAQWDAYDQMAQQEQADHGAHQQDQGQQQQYSHDQFGGQQHGQWDQGYQQGDDGYYHQGGHVQTSAYHTQQDSQSYRAR